jgi:hypothetical protein
LIYFLHVNRGSGPDHPWDQPLRSTADPMAVAVLGRSGSPRAELRAISDRTVTAIT